MKQISILFLAVTALAPVAANDLEPLMAVPREIVFRHDFEKGKLTKEQWTARQKTRWEIKDGVLAGIPSTPETQASRPHHKGLEPRGSAGLTPMNFVAKLSIRYFGDIETPQTPFIRKGKIEIDNFTIWSAGAGESAKGWNERKSAFPAFEPVVMQKRVAQLAKKKAANKTRQ